MSVEVYATRLITEEEFLKRQLPEPLVFEKSEHNPKGYTIMWPERGGIVVYVAHKSGYQRNFKENAIYFEVFGSGKKAGPIFAKLEELFDCEFVTELGAVLTEEEGVDSDTWDQDTKMEAVHAIEVTPGALTEFFKNVGPYKEVEKT
jgi:hypothetical protein